MKIDWRIDYENMTASCGQMIVVIKKTTKEKEQIVKKMKILFGFTKIETGENYIGHIIYISDTLLEETKAEPNLLARYASQLGDHFNEYIWEDARKEDIRETLGRFPRQQELADYLGVNKSTVSGYPQNKKNLMLHGLWIKKRIK